MLPDGPVQGHLIAQWEGGIGQSFTGRAKEFVEHLTDKIAQIHSQCESMCGAGPLERPGLWICQIVWE